MNTWNGQKFTFWKGTAPVTAFVPFFQSADTFILKGCTDMKIFQAFICYIFDDYGLQLMKTPKSTFSQYSKLDFGVFISCKP